MTAPVCEVAKLFDTILAELFVAVLTELFVSLRTCEALVSRMEAFY